MAGDDRDDVEGDCFFLRLQPAIAGDAARRLDLSSCEEEALECLAKFWLEESNARKFPVAQLCRISGNLDEGLSSLSGRLELGSAGMRERMARQEAMILGSAANKAGSDEKGRRGI